MGRWMHPGLPISFYIDGAYRFKDQCGAVDYLIGS